MRPSFRHDIQGLRALAVVLVALDHARIGPLHGGFIGVDVFFVISGFLITGLLLEEADRRGTVNLVGFYARRARRILPAATLVVVVTVLASLAVLSAVEARSAIEDALWATLFVANVKFARDGTDYFNAEASASPLQHYWSLAVEEQFYVVWPALVLVLCLVLRWRARRGPLPAPSVRGAAARVLGVVVVVSFVASVVWTPQASVEAYFSTLTRAWELGLGALVACVAPRLAQLPRWSAGLASWLGLGMVGVAAFTYDGATLFPGYAVALPVVGTALLVAGGLTPARWGPQGLLGLRPLRSVGDWSYSFYLWHWPALILAGALWGTPSGFSGGSVLLVSLALAGLTYTYVETPFRTARLITRRHRRGLLLYPAVLVVTLPLLVGANRIVELQVAGGGAAITASSYGATLGPTLSEEDRVQALVRASVLAARDDHAVPAGLQPGVLDLEEDKPGVGACTYFEIDQDRPLCPRGDLTGDRTLVLVGDSHARQWIPALDVLSARYGYTAYYLVREGCPASDVTPWLNDGSGPSTACASFQDWAADQVAELQPDVVVMASDSNRQGFEGDDGTQVTDDASLVTMFQAGIEQQIARIRDHTDRVVVIGDPPALQFSPGVCLSEHGASLGDCMGEGDPRSIAMIKALKRGTLQMGADYIGSSQWFCYQGDCPTVIGGYIARLDRAHITASYARSLADALEARLHLDPAAG